MSSSNVKQAGGLQVGEDLEFQEKEWKAQRLVWALFALLLLLAAAGLFGDGFLAHARAGEEGENLWVNYQRFARIFSPQKMQVSVRPQAFSAQDAVEIRVDREFIEGVRIESIEPEPSSVELQADSYVYTFEVGELQQAHEIDFDVQFLRIGFHRAWFGVPAGDEVHLAYFVYP